MHEPAKRKRDSAKPKDAIARSPKKRAAKESFAATAAHVARNRRIHGLQPWLHSFAAPRLRKNLVKRTRRYSLVVEKKVMGPHFCASCAPTCAFCVRFPR